MSVACYVNDRKRIHLLYIKPDPDLLLINQATLRARAVIPFTVKQWGHTMIHRLTARSSLFLSSRSFIYLITSISTTVR
jgi:hypothetical protein